MALACNPSIWEVRQEESDVQRQHETLYPRKRHYVSQNSLATLIITRTCCCSQHMSSYLPQLNVITGLFLSRIIVPLEIRNLSQVRFIKRESYKKAFQGCNCGRVLAYHSWGSGFNPYCVLDINTHMQKHTQAHMHTHAHAISVCPSPKFFSVLSEESLESLGSWNLGIQDDSCNKFSPKF